MTTLELQSCHRLAVPAFTRRRVLFRAVSAAAGVCAGSTRSAWAEILICPGGSSECRSRAEWLGELAIATAPIGKPSDRQPVAKDVAGMLFLGRFADPVYFLVRPVSWKPGPRQPQRLHPVKVPAGFVTDFASIPQVFWSMLRPDGLYAYAAVIHDYLYWFQKVRKVDADEIFWHCMLEFGVEQDIADAIYTAVRLGGGSAWRRNAELRAAGEQRVLTAWPTDPTQTWADWRARRSRLRKGER